MLKITVKIHTASERLPKLLPINPNKHRYQPMSKRCLVWWKWKNNINNKIMALDDSPRFATMFRGHWSIEGISGETEVLRWCYVPVLDEL